MSWLTEFGGNMIKTTINQGQLLLGRPGLPMLSDAFNFAKKYLNTENLDTHPDYLFLGKASGKKSISVDDAAEVVKKAALKPALASKIIIIIDGIDDMTIPAQNKILKTLEDAENALVIAISYGGFVLDTIKSRLSVTTYRVLPQKEFCEKLQQLDPSLDSSLYYYLSGGNTGVIDELKTFDGMWQSVRDAVERGLYKNLLPALHLLKEKDAAAISNTGYSLYALYLMRELFTEKLIAGAGDMCKLRHIISMICQNINICNTTVYTKDNFFLLIVQIIEIGG